MELDSKNLGRLRRVANPRDVWVSESGDFTPWLAQNIDVLAEALGIGLTVIATEVQVGEFRLDIKAEDEDGRVVVIENQLERTDHGHLGQCLVYASGLDASTVVWVAPQFRENYRRTLDWLNERTDLGVNFFGVEVGVVQIGDGPRAPVFDVVSRPNDWQKAVKGAGAGAGESGPATVSPINARRQDFYAEVLSSVIAVQPSIRMPARSRGNWLAFASGPFGYWAISVAADGRLRLEAYIDTGDKATNKELFDEFAASASVWETQLALDIDWERLDEKRASRIAVYQALDLEDAIARSLALQQASQTLARMFGVLNEPLRTRGKAIRDSRAAGLDALDLSDEGSAARSESPSSTSERPVVPS